MYVIYFERLLCYFIKTIIDYEVYNLKQYFNVCDLFSKVIMLFYKNNYRLRSIHFITNI